MSARRLPRTRKGRIAFLFVTEDSAIASTHLSFTSVDSHREYLRVQGALPQGFKVGSARLEFIPQEVPKPSRMTLTLIALDTPTNAFAALFTKNAFPGAPVLVGRRRREEETLGAVLINNKVSNVCAPGGEEAAETLCESVGQMLSLQGRQVLPCSTGVIGWRLPVAQMQDALPRAVASLSSDSVLPAAEGIVTTDLYPKVRRAELFGGSLVGIAKGAGMIEPNLATMLVFLLTDLDVPRLALRKSLEAVAQDTFGSMSVDSDTSTSDTVALLSSRMKRCPDVAAFEAALFQVCADLAEDIVRNGEGVHHVMRVRVRGAPSREIARGVGKSVVNSPLFQCAVTGNDPNVGRLVAAVGKYIGAQNLALEPQKCRFTLGGQTLFSQGQFQLTPEKEAALVAHLRSAELYASVPPADGLTFKPPIQFPPHERCVEIEVDLGMGVFESTVLGADRSHEYISENADYRS